VTWVDVAKSVQSEVAALRSRARALSQPRELSKRVLAMHTEALVWLRGDFTLQERVWLNGAEDFYIQRVLTSVLSSSATVVRREPDVGTQQADVRNFDFVWNIRMGRTEALYGSPANDTMMLSRLGLGVLDRGHELTFSHPAYLKSGDAVGFKVKPIYYTSADAGMAFRVRFTLVGYRTGAMAA